ncbi:ras guanine nucleotide exchange factor domain-containing protein [Lactarius vividus]|nr:ras guanine nucleotide exchange factor domain-containing protein [Lactarius vividus]
MMTPPLPLNRLADIEATGWPRRGSSTPSLASARLPTLREDDHDLNNLNIPTSLSAPAQSSTLSPLPSGRSKPSSRPSSAPNPSPHRILAPDLQRHASVDSTSSRSSTSTGESALRSAMKPSRWLPFPKRSRTSISETGDPVTVPEKSPKPLTRSRTNPTETSNAVPPPSRSATSLLTLTPIRHWVPVSDQVLGFLEEAACDSESLLRPATDGSVSAGNLEGLVSRVIAGSADPFRDERFKATFLTIYQLFASSEQLFNILKRRFESAPLDPVAVRVRYNILVFVESWLKKGFEDPELTCSSKIREFARSVSGSQTMETKAGEIVGLVDDPDHVRLRNPESSPRLRCEPVPYPPGVTASDVANALTVIEGSRFERVTYWDYVNFARQRPNTRRIDVFNTVHDLIETWVQTTVLEFDFVDERMKKYDFWVTTAQACRKLNNFSSTSAIVTALLSPTITNLALTCESRATKQSLHGLAKELTPTDGSYRNMIRNAATKELIPWLNPHLASLNSTFVQSNPIMEVDGHALIDFKLLSELAEQVESIVQYTPPRIEHATHQGVLAYIEYSLKSITTASHASTDVLSAQLALDERKMFEHRARMRSLGIPWSPPRRK